MFPAIACAMMLPNDSPLMWLSIAAIAWCCLVAVFGAILGIFLAAGKLQLGCPSCSANSHVAGGHGDGMFLECPKCGWLRVQVGQLGRLRVARIESEDDDLADWQPDSVSPLRHRLAFALLYLPVVLSIAAATILHEFLWFYLLIPGFWCYAAGGFLLNAIFSGQMRDNHGSTLRSRSPFSFWSKFAVWLLFYVFAASFPLGFALQERSKESSAPPTVKADR